jgi:arylformamidase
MNPPSFFDISLPLGPGTPTYPGDPQPFIDRVTDARRGDRLTTSRFALGCHVGTHVDAPAHFLPDGASIEDLGLHHFMGPAVVIEVVGRRVVTASDLSGLPIPNRCHVLIKTDNSRLLDGGAFSPDYSYFRPDAIEVLCERDPLSVGIDYYSLDPVDSPDYPAHAALAARGLPAYVCLDLRRVSAGAYSFAGLPLRLQGVEACPVRAILWRV